MNITEVRIKLTRDHRNKLKAYCSVTLDDAFAVRDLKIIEGANGLFVAMPSRKLADRCPHCRTKNHLRAAFCNGCGGKLDPDRAHADHRGRSRLHADLAHPINSESRSDLHRVVVKALEDEIERSKQADYVPPSFDDFDELLEEDHADHPPTSRHPREHGAEADHPPTSPQPREHGAEAVHPPTSQHRRDRGAEADHPGQAAAEH